FALGDKVIGNPQLATFAAFGSFAMLLLVDFGGPMAERLQAEAALGIVGGVFVCLATLASQTAWSAAVAMAVVGFGVIFAGVVSSVLAGATRGCCWRSSCRCRCPLRRRPCPTGWLAGGWPEAPRWLP